MNDVDEIKLTSEIDEISKKIEVILKNIEMMDPEKSIKEGGSEGGQGV